MPLRGTTGGGGALGLGVTLKRVLFNQKISTLFAITWHNRWWGRSHQCDVKARSLQPENIYALRHFVEEGSAQTGANSEMKATLTILPKARTEPRIRKEVSPAKIARADTIGEKPPTEPRLTGKDKELAKLKRDAEKWRSRQQQANSRRSASEATITETSERVASESKSGGSRYMIANRTGRQTESDEIRMKEGRKKYLRHHLPDKVTPDELTDTSLEEMRMHRWLESMTEWMISYDSCWNEPVSNQDKVRMFGDQLKGTALNWIAGIKENEKARNKEFKSSYYNMQDINRHAYDKLMRGEISMRNLEY